MIVLERLEKTYELGGRKKVALQAVSLTLSPGEILAVIGHSGCGKSTLLRCLNGSIKPSSGRIEVFGNQVHCLRGSQLLQFRQQVGTFTAPFGLQRGKSVAENLTLPLCFAGWQKAAIAKRLEILMHWLELSDYRNHSIYQLTVWQQWLVAFGRALANRPRLLICDVGFLSPVFGHRFCNLLEKIRNLNAATNFVVASVNLSELPRLRPQVAVMSQGRVVEVGPTHAILSQPQHAITYDYVQWQRQLLVPQTLGLV